MENWKNRHPVVVALCEGSCGDIQKHVESSDKEDARWLAEYMEKHGKEYGAPEGHDIALKVQARLLVKYYEK